jgi:hypothetical protein
VLKIHIREVHKNVSYWSECSFLFKNWFFLFFGKGGDGLALKAIPELLPKGLDTAIEEVHIFVTFLGKVLHVLKAFLLVKMVHDDDLVLLVHVLVELR